MHITAQAELMTAATYLGELMIIPTQRMHGPDVTSLRGAGGEMSARTTRSYSGIRHVGFASLNNLETDDFHRDLLTEFGKGPCKHTRTRQDMPHTLPRQLLVCLRVGLYSRHPRHLPVEWAR